MIIISHASAFGNYFTDFFSISAGRGHSPHSTEDANSITADKSEIQTIHSISDNQLWTRKLLSVLDPIESRDHWLTEIYRTRYNNLESKNIAETSPTPSVRLALNDYTNTMTDATLSTAIQSDNALKHATQKTQHLTSSKHPNAGQQPKSFPAPIAKPYPAGYVEGAVLYGHLTNGYGDWVNQYIKSFVQINNNNGVGLQLAHDYEYGEHGDYAVGDLLHIINEDWYTSFGLGISNKTIFVPKYYIGGAVFRKFSATHRWIAYLGAHAYWWRPVYKTEDINPGLIYYFEKAWVIEIGTLLNQSNPGNVYSAAGYIAVTQGRVKEHYLTLRYGFGKEAYLPLGINVPGAVGYISNVITATWRQWWGQSFGTHIVGEAYTNKFYNRYGISIGLFKDF